MFVAHKLKQENIAEYLLYMWQVEDIIRAFGLDLEKIDSQLLSTYGLDADQHRQEQEWYESLIDMMRRENVVSSGHIQLIKNVLLDMNDVHLSLLQSGEQPAYNAKFYQLLPSLTYLKSKASDPTVSDLEMCFVFLYGIMNLRRQQKEISADTQQMAENISKLLAMLAKAYTVVKIDA